MRAGLVAVLLVLALPAAAARAAPQLVPVGTFAEPVHVAAPPGDAARLFVVEKAGRVQVVVNGQQAAAPFLDVDASIDAAGERGLLSIAFAPDYVTSGLFYVFYTDNGGDIVVAEGARSASDPNRGALSRALFTIEHSSATNHNGGQLAFGRDGALYVSTGDGATTPATAQDPATRLGKILRVDLRAGPEPAVWALGLRNPWRFSFDRATGDMLVGDVGEGTSEEVDLGPPGIAGRNYGWNLCEGAQPSCPPGTVPPVLDLPRGAGFSGVIGGFVVRDPGLPSLLGRYLFADLGKNRLQSAALGTDPTPKPEESLPISSPSSFGEDACGRLYVASLGGGVWRIQDGAPSSCPTLPPEPAPPARPGPPPASGDTTPCAVRAGIPRKQRIVRRGRRLRVTLRADEPCTATVRAKRFRTRRGVALRAGVTRVVRLAPTRRGLRRLRRAKARSERGRVVVRVRVHATDAAGNERLRRVSRRVR